MNEQFRIVYESSPTEHSPYPYGRSERVSLQELVVALAPFGVVASVISAISRFSDNDIEGVVGSLAGGALLLGVTVNAYTDHRKSVKARDLALAGIIGNNQSEVKSPEIPNI